jgi:hypothetical protein
MSKLISKLLDAQEPGFAMTIRQLEEITGRQGIDVRLTAEIMAKLRLTVQQLGLDSTDTTPKELYFSLMSKIKVDDSRFVSLIGAQFANEPSQLLEPVVKAVGSLDIPKKCWVIKKSVAKELLKITPPKNIMRRLHYQSIDSMLKNENIVELYGALRFAETAAWLKRFNKGYQTLTPSDFEIRSIEILAMPQDRWATLSNPTVTQKGHFVTNVKELGAIIILPPSTQRCAGYATLLALLIIHYVNEIRAYSSFFKLQQVKPDFSKLMADTLNNDNAYVAVLGGQALHWRVIQRHLGKKRSAQPEIFEPHVQWEDLQWHKAEKCLAKIDPTFSWWRDLDYCGLRQGKAVVSLNLMDAVLNYYCDLDYKEAGSSFLKTCLWNELFSRYMGEKILEQQVLRQLDVEMLTVGSLFDNLSLEDI